MKRIKRTIINKIKNSQFVITVHARKRMSERFVSEVDIIEVANTLESIVYQEKRDTFLLTGFNTWEQQLKISAAIRSEVIIVTVFFEEDENENNNYE